MAVITSGVLYYTSIITRLATW